LTKLSVIKDNDNKAILPCFSGNFHSLYSTNTVLQ